MYIKWCGASLFEGLFPLAKVGSFVFLLFFAVIKTFLIFVKNILTIFMPLSISLKLYVCRIFIIARCVRV